MTREEFIKKIIEIVDSWDEDEKVYAWNERCEAYRYYDDRIDCNTPNEMFCSSTPEEILSYVNLDGKYNPNDVYCCMNGYGEYVSFDYTDDNNSPFDIEALAEYMFDEAESFDDCDIEELFEELEEDEEED